MDLQISIAGLLTSAVCLVLVYWYPIRSAYLSPLSKFPAIHWSCHIAPFWLWWARAYGWENRKTLASHQQKGSILRVAPNVLHINSEEGLKTIYNGDFPRSGFYWAAFKNYETHHMVTVGDGPDHSTRRKKFTTVFTKSAVLNSPTLHAVFQTVLHQRLLPCLQELAAKKQPLEVFKTIYGVAMDLFVCWQFGVASGSNWTQDVQDRDRYLTAYTGKAKYFFRSTEALGLVTLLQRFGINLLPKTFWECNDVCEQWSLDLCDKAAQVIARNSQLDVADDPVIFRHALKTMCSIENASIPKDLAQNYPRRLEIASEMFSFNAAAHEGGAIPLSWVTYELGRRPQYQDMLRKELESLAIPLKQRGMEKDGAEFPALKDVNNLPLLDAIVMETMRLYPVIGGPQPRTTPWDMSLGGSSVIPAGTTVQCSAWSLHRNPEVFPNPDSWYPERWLDVTPTQLSMMRRWFFAFGNGSRMCIGIHFALLSLKMIVALIYSNFETSIQEHGDMRHADAYLSGPVDQEKLLISLKAI